MMPRYKLISIECIIATGRKTFLSILFLSFVNPIFRLLTFQPINSSISYILMRLIRQRSQSYGLKIFSKKYFLCFYREDFWLPIPVKELCEELCRLQIL